MNNWKKLDFTFQSHSIFDVELKRSNRIIIGWFYGLLLEAAFNYMIYLSQGLSMNSTCYEAYPNYSLGEFFFYKIFPTFFKILPFNYPLGIFILFVDCLLNVAWAFNDAFVVLISQLLTRNFVVINKKLALNIEVRIVFLVSELLSSICIFSKIKIISCLAFRTNRKSSGWNILKRIKSYASM